MTEEAIKQVIDKEIESKSQKLFHEMLGAVHARTDHLFANLLICEWIAGLLVALVISPRTWYGAYSDVHIHVYTAILLGGLILATDLPGPQTARPAEHKKFNRYWTDALGRALDSFNRRSH